MAPASKHEQQSFLKYSDDTRYHDAEFDRQQSPPNERRTRFLSYFSVFFVTSLLWMIVTFASSRSWKPTHEGGRHNITSSAKLITCGHSTTEAKTRGCKYEILLNNWIPAPCFDDEFIEEYQDDQSWGAFADEDLTRRLTVDEMSESDFYYTSARDHINHCAVIWKKQFLVLFEERRAMDTIIANPYHTDHCAQFLMDVPELNLAQATKVDRGFAGCWIRE